MASRFLESADVEQVSNQVDRKLVFRRLLNGGCHRRNGIVPSMNVEALRVY